MGLGLLDILIMTGLLTGKVCVVTGATRGIGRAVATALANEGGVVIGTGTTDDGAQQISEYLIAAGGQGEGMQLNVNDSDSITEFHKRVEQNHGPVNVLVNNAGISRNNLLMRIKDAEWQEVIDTNLSSVFRLSRICVRAMLKQRDGRIINISSVVGAVGNAGQAHYAATKSALMGFSKSLAMEVATRNVTVNVVAPGFIDTDMTSSLGEKVQDNLLSSIPMGRMGRAEEVANAVVFLASAQSSYITGSTLFVDGGMIRH